MTEREGMVEELGEFLERLGHRLRHMERDHDRWERRSERMHERAERMAERMADKFGFSFRFDRDESEDEEELEGAGIERELLFGEQPELRLTAGPMRVYLRQVEPGGKARVVLKGHGVEDADLEVGSWDGAIAVEVRPSHGLHSFRRFSRLALYVYLPEGVRVRARVDAGSMMAEGLQGAELDLRTDAGKLRLANCQGRLRLASSAGKIVIESCMGDLDAHTDAGKIDLRGFSGTVQLRAQAGAVACRALRLVEGEHLLETKLGSIDAALLPDAPLHIETRASLGSISNRIGEGPADAPVRLTARTELGSIRLRYDEAPPTPLHQVPFTDERADEDRGSASRGPVDRGQVPPTDEREPGEVAPSAEHQPAATDERAGGTAEAAAAGPDQQSETLRILGMVERHEISADEAASLLAALRRGQ